MTITVLRNAIREVLASLVQDGFKVVDITWQDDTTYDVTYMPRTIEVLKTYKLHMFMSNGTDGFYDMVVFRFAGSMTSAILHGNAIVEEFYPGYTAYAQMIFVI